MSQTLDPLAFLWREMEEAIDSEATDLVSNKGILTSLVTISKAADDTQLQSQSPLHVGILSMEQRVERLVSGT